MTKIKLYREFDSATLLHHPIAIKNTQKAYIRKKLLVNDVRAIAFKPNFVSVHGLYGITAQRLPAIFVDFRGILSNLVS